MTITGARVFMKAGSLWNRYGVPRGATFIIGNDKRCYLYVDGMLFETRAVSTYHVVKKRVARYA